jgi:hypothetical protein
MSIHEHELAILKDPQLKPPPQYAHAVAELCSIAALWMHGGYDAVPRFSERVKPWHIYSRYLALPDIGSESDVLYEARLIQNERGDWPDHAYSLQFPESDADFFWIEGGEAVLGRQTGEEPTMFTLAGILRLTDILASEEAYMFDPRIGIEDDIIQYLGKLSSGEDGDI